MTWTINHNKAASVVGESANQRTPVGHVRQQVSVATLSAASADPVRVTVNELYILEP